MVLQAFEAQRAIISDVMRFETAYLEALWRDGGGVGLDHGFLYRRCPNARNGQKRRRLRPHLAVHPRANIRASLCSTGATASIRRAAASSTVSPAVSTTAEARAYSGSRPHRRGRPRA